jgi:hypothetical protein
MKKVLSILALFGAVTAGYSQGLVSTSAANAAYAISTNNTALGVAGIGKTFGSAADTGGQSYDYILLYSATAIAPVTYNSSASTIAAWSLGPTETSGVGPGYIAGASNAQMGNAGTTYYIELVGWSTSLGSSFANNIESVIESDSTSTAGQYLGFGYQSAAGLVSSVVTTASAPASGTTIFSATGINQGFQLLTVPTPEPTTIALGVMGAASLLALRRKKA